MQWLRSDFRFDLRRCVFVLSARDKAASEVYFLLEENADPEALRSSFEAKLLCERPELQGAIISHIQFDYRRQCWLIGVFHGSLPETQDGDSCPERPFRKGVWAEEEKDEVDKTWR